MSTGLHRMGLAAGRKSILLYPDGDSLGQMGPDIYLAEKSPSHTTGSYRAWELSGADANVVDLAWHSRIEHGHPEAHRLLPFSEPSLVLVRRFDRTGRTEEFRIAFTCALPDGGYYCPEPGEEIFGLRLAPEWIETTIGLRAAELVDCEYEVPRHILSKMDDAYRLADRDRFGAAWRSMLGALVELGGEGGIDRLGYAASLSRKASGRMTPRELAEWAEISPRHLRRGFAERYGLSPIGWARRLRLAAAMLEAEKHDRPNWAGIAAGNRFSDQAHLIRECRAIMGESPREFHTQRRSMAVSFNT